MYELLRHRITAPRAHVRTPGCVSREMSERPERDRNHHYGQNRNRPALPTLFTFAGKKWKKKQSGNHHHWPNQKRRRLERRREQREQSIEPEEKVIRFRSSLDDRGIRPAGRPERSEIQRARGDGQNNKRCEKHVFPYGIGNERSAVFLCQLMVIAHVR